MIFIKIIRMYYICGIFFGGYYKRKNIFFFVFGDWICIKKVCFICLKNVLINNFFSLVCMYFFWGKYIYKKYIY